MKALIFDIQRGSYVDGPGIRTTVFFKGCNLRCKWCHNPESRSTSAQILFYKDKCISCGKCAQVCPHGLKKCTLCGKCETFCPTSARKLCGVLYTPDEIVSEILKDKPYYGNSGGVTFSGGECMLNVGFLEECLRLCKSSGVNIAVDTAGNVKWASFERVLPLTDLFLYDVKCVSPDLHVLGTGADNRLILDNLAKLSRSGAKIIVRVPLIPGFNDDEREFVKIADLLSGLNIVKVEVLPYHSMGEHKWAAAGLSPTRYRVPSASEIEKFRGFFAK